jgi:hypothetical protein
MITPPDASKCLPQMGLSPKQRDRESSGWPLLKFSVHTGCICHTALGERPSLRTCAGLLIHRRHEPAQQFAAATRAYANRYRSGLSANTTPREEVGPETKFRRPDFLRGTSCLRENVERNRSPRSAARRTGQQDDWYAEYIVHEQAGKRLTPAAAPQPAQTTGEKSCIPFHVARCWQRPLPEAS